MVDEHRNIMAFMDIFAHLHILRRKRRGIQPEVVYGNLQVYNSYTPTPISTFDHLLALLNPYNSTSTAGV